MSNPQMHFHRLIQIEQHGSDSQAYRGLWKMASKFQRALWQGGHEAREWAWKGISFYRTADTRVLWVAVPEDMDLADAAKTIAERLGRVEMSEE